MAVHHAHHPSHKKRWTEYLLEFFMLFLAVFLGFIAENIREHIVEKHRARDLAISLISDMEEDTAQINKLNAYRMHRAEIIDSFYFYLQEKPQEVDRKHFYRLAKLIQGSRYFSPSTGTINQLKSAGYLRYFTKTKLPALLSEYEAIYTDCALDEKIENAHLYDRYYATLIKTTDAESLDSLFNHPSQISGKGITTIPDPDVSELKKIITMVKYQNTVFIRAGGQFQQLKAKQVEIIQHLEHEYH
jgi:hypothetical protein